MIREFCSKVINFDSKCWRSDLNVEIEDLDVHSSVRKSRKKIFYRKEQIKLKEIIIRYLWLCRTY